VIFFPFQLRREWPFARPHAHLRGILSLSLTPTHGGYLSIQSLLHFYLPGSLFRLAVVECLGSPPLPATSLGKEPTSPHYCIPSHIHRRIPHAPPSTPQHSLVGRSLASTLGLHPLIFLHDGFYPPSPLRFRSDCSSAT